jgi:hypothetical protein
VAPTARLNRYDQPMSNARDMARHDRSPTPFPPCWGIGLSRTGTSSLCAALLLLGYERIAHNPDFGELAGLQGGADSGVTVFYKYLDYRHPGSKFVLMTREMESWLTSMEYIFRRNPIRSLTADVGIMRRMTLYETVGFDRTRHIAAYQRHREDVVRYFADRPDDLLEMCIVDGEGWEKLCPFLSLPQPSSPFPHENRSLIGP